MAEAVSKEPKELLHGLPVLLISLPALIPIYHYKRTKGQPGDNPRNSCGQLAMACYGLLWLVTARYGLPQLRAQDRRHCHK
jgi:hypothetical protein